MSKSKQLLTALGEQFKDSHGRPSLKTSGATMPTSTGNRLAKLTRVITYVSVEGAVHFDSAEDDMCAEWHIMSLEEMQRALVAVPRRGTESKSSAVSRRVEDGEGGAEKMEEELVQIRSSQETQNLVVEKEAMSLGLGSQMEEGEATEEEDVFGRSTVLKNRRDTVVGQETPTQSGGVQESVDMFTDTFLPIADISVDSTTRVAQKPHGAREGGAGRRGAKSVAHTELLPQEGRTVEKRRHGTRGGGGERGGEQAGGEPASVSTEVPVQDQTRTKRIRYKPASKDIK